MLNKYKAITSGVVTQEFEKQDEKFVCVEQSFTAGSPIDRVNEQGKPVDIDIREEKYQHYNMVQPGFDYYVVGMRGCVEPVLHGPFATDDAQQRCIGRLRAGEGEDTNTFFVVNVSKGATVEL